MMSSMLSSASVLLPTLNRVHGVGVMQVLVSPIESLLPFFFIRSNRLGFRLGARNGAQVVAVSCLFDIVM
jgi:hypothetical protein